MIRLILIFVALIQVTRCLSQTNTLLKQALQTDYITCTVYKLSGLAYPGTSHQNISPLSCRDDYGGPSIYLDGGYENLFGVEDFVSGTKVLKIPTDIISHKLRVNMDDQFAVEKIVVSDKYQNLLPIGDQISKKSKGVHKVLVVRVSDRWDHSPTHNAQQISEHVFSGDLTMTKQLRKCSNNALILQKVNGREDVQNGVVDVVVDANLGDAEDSFQCVTEADAALQSLDIGTTHTYTMYICPGEMEFGSAAWGEIDGSKTWYHDLYGSYPFVQMHELGHNLSFLHSGEGEIEYGDPIGIMGGKYFEDLNWGRVCFNAAKSYATTWYSEFQSSVNPKIDSYTGTLVDLNSFFLGNFNDEDNVVVRVRTLSNTHVTSPLYLMLHRLDGFTSDIIPEFQFSHANRVSIVQEEAAAASKALAHLANGDEYTQQNWAGTGNTLHIKVCSLSRTFEDGGAKIIVYLEGANFASCDTSNPSLTIVPKATSAPVASPTHDPSCVDSDLKMFFSNGQKRGCTWVANNKTEDRCQKKGVASHCPHTCGTCILCRDSGKRFLMKAFEKQIKSCSWVGRVSGRCGKEGVGSTCRSTCGLCVS